MSRSRDTGKGFHDKEEKKRVDLSPRAGRGDSRSSERANQGLQDRAAINQKEEYPLPQILRVGEFQRPALYMFQMQLTWSDVLSGRLSIPFQTAELHFPRTNRVPNYEYQIAISDAQNDIWYMTLTYIALESTAFKFVITTGWPEFVYWHDLKDMDVIRFYKPLTRLHANHYLIDFVKTDGNVVISESKSGCSCSYDRVNQNLRDGESEFDRMVFLFELQLTLNDVQQGRLFIPLQTAVKHFPPIPTHRPDYDGKRLIQISDIKNHNYHMTLLYNSSHSAFIITSGWHRFVVRHGLEVMDAICFYRPLARIHDTHFLILYIKGGVTETDKFDPPELKPENFLFQLQLTSSNVSFGWLMVPKEEVRSHFPAIEIPRGTRLLFTDARNKEWSMTIFFAKELDVYLILEGWEGFVNRHRLEAMDVIRLYKPDNPLREGHFLIECVKREEAAAANEGDRANRGCRNHGGRGGPSHGGDGPGKGKAIGCWSWKN